jgi:hypothetical protein
MLCVCCALCLSIAGCGGDDGDSASEPASEPGAQTAAPSESADPLSRCVEAWNAAANEASHAGLVAFLSGDNGQPVMGTWSKAALKVPVYLTATTEKPNGSVTVERDTCIATRRGGSTSFPFAYIEADGRWRLTKDEEAAGKLLRGLTDARSVSPDSLGKLKLG